MVATPIAACSDDQRAHSPGIGGGAVAGGGGVGGGLGDGGAGGGGGDDGLDDGGVGDDGGGDVDMLSCAADGPFDILTSVTSASELELDLVARPGSALLVAKAKPADIYPGQAVVAARIDSDGNVDEPLTLSDLSPANDLKAPAVIATASGFRAFFSDTRDGTAAYDIRFRDVSAAGAATGVVGDVTATELTAETPIFVLEGASSTLALLFSTPDSEPAEVLGTTLGADGSPETLPVALTTSPALTTPLRLAWVGTVPYAAFRGADGQLYTVALGTDGKSAGTPHVVSEEAGVVQAHFDFAAWDGARAIAFEHESSGKSEVHFVPLDSNAEAPYTETTLSGTSEHGYVPSLAPLAGGYVVAYRHAPGANVTARILLVGAYGGVVDTRDLAAVTGTSGDVRVRSSADGVVYVVWEDETTIMVPGDDTAHDATVVRAAVVHCD